jgi:hypothetical protein
MLVLVNDSELKMAIGLAIAVKIFLYRPDHYRGQKIVTYSGNNSKINTQSAVLAAIVNFLKWQLLLYLLFEHRR